MSEPLTDAELASIRRRTGEGAPDGESIDVEAEEVLRLLDEVTRARVLHAMAAKELRGERSDGTWDDAVKMLEQAAAGALPLDDWSTRARALLKRIEWGLLRDECPACGGAGEHRPDCELAALIGGK